MSPVIKFVLIYYAVINFALFVMMGSDKLKAKQNRWRTPEATLLGAAFLGGSVGGILGSKIFRHKTQKAKFQILFPLAFIVHAVLWCALIFWTK